MPDRSLTWAPRVGGAGFATLLATVGIESFFRGAPTASAIIALIMHLLLAGVVLLLVFYCWHREWVGGVVTTLLGAFYLWTDGESVPWGDAPLILGSLSVLGLLYFWNAERRRRTPTPARTSGQTSARTSGGFPARTSGAFAARTSGSSRVIPETPPRRSSGALRPDLPYLD